MINAEKNVLVDFPEVTGLKLDAAMFSKLTYSRKNAAYKPALEIARFIILNFAPNIAAGKENMLALLFDMNSLWEEYVLAKLKSAKEDEYQIKGQSSKRFWNSIHIRPDIVIKKENKTFVIDTKWKQISGCKPTTHDLRQMFVYNKYWNSQKAILLYPASKTETPKFICFDNVEQACAIGRINILDGEHLKKNLGEEILGWF